MRKAEAKKEVRATKNRKQTPRKRCDPGGGRIEGSQKSASSRQIKNPSHRAPKSEPREKERDPRAVELRQPKVRKVTTNRNPRKGL